MHRDIWDGQCSLVILTRGCYRASYTDDGPFLCKRSVPHPCFSHRRSPPSLSSITSSCLFPLSKLFLVKITIFDHREAERKAGDQRVDATQGQKSITGEMHGGIPSIGQATSEERVSVWAWHQFSLIRCRIQSTFSIPS